MINCLPISEYMDELASSSPAPGGGAVAAVTGAQAAALLSMVCNLTIGKPKFASVEHEVSELLAVFEEKRKLMQQSAEEDVQVFNDVMAAYRLPKSNESEKAERAVKIQEALKISSETPFALFKCCRELIPLADRLESIGNPMLVSDVLVAKQLINAATASAIINVEVNLASISDAEFCESKRREMNA